MVDYNKEFDELKMVSVKTITRQFEPEEKIVFSTKINKINDKNKSQARDFLLTNKFIYNLKKTDIKRKIQTDKVSAITVSKTSNEFVIHVPEEYDYRYSHATKRERIVKLIDQLYREMHDGKAIQINQKEAINLDKFTTKKDDRKKGIVRMPEPVGEVPEKNTTKPDAMGNSTIYSKDKGKQVTIEDFALLKQLGKGAFGKVMLVKKKDTGELFALKSIKKLDLLEKGTLEYTRTEQMILEKLKHPFLVSLEYCFTTKEKIYFAMQFMKGGALFKYLRQEKRFSEDRVKFYVAQVALGLSHLHLNHVLYRDMKPENVLMDEKGHICLADFGMAKVLKEGEEATSFCGTQEYLAPEIITREGHGKEADWWELGIFTYELLVGEPPFRNPNDAKLFELIKFHPVTFPPQIEISEMAKDFIAKCLEKNPKNRLGCQGDFAQVQSHAWLRDIDWQAMLEKKTEPPFKPLIQSETSSSYSNEESIHESSKETNMK